MNTLALVGQERAWWSCGVCVFRVFAAGVLWSTMSGKGIVFNSPRPYVAVGRAALLFFYPLNASVSWSALQRLLKGSFWYPPLCCFSSRPVFEMEQDCCCWTIYWVLYTFGILTYFGDSVVNRSAVSRKNNRIQFCNFVFLLLISLLADNQQY